MFDRFTDRAKKVMNLARQEAQLLNHEYLGTEHILLGLVQEGSGVAANVLKLMGIDLNKIRAEVEKLVKAGPSMVTMGQLPFTPRAKKALELSLEEASNIGHNYIGTEHLLLGLIKENEGIAAQALMNLGVKLKEVREEVLDFLGAESPEESEEIRVETPALDSFGRDLTKNARDGKFEAPIGVEDTIRRLIQILGRRNTRNAALLGSPGIGKQAVVEGVALRIVEGGVSNVLRACRLVEIDLGAVKSGKRSPRELLGLILRESHTGNAVLYFREIEVLFDDSEVYPAFREALLRDQCQVLVTSSERAFAARAEQDPAFGRSFEWIRLAPPLPSVALEVLKGQRDRLEAHHRVVFSDDSFVLAVELSGLYLPDRPLPGRALGLLDEAGAVAAVRQIEPPAELRELSLEASALDGRKQEAVNKQDFDLAARLREDAYRLRKRRDELEAEWRRAMGSAGSVEVLSDDLSEALSRMTGIAAEDIEARRSLPTPRTASGASSILEGVSRHERTMIQSVLPQDELVIQRGRAFVLIPHRPAFETLYARAIAPALAAHGLEPVKGNDIAEPGGVLPQVWRELRSAEVVVAVLTGRNPNVIYELGLCHGIRRCPILLVEDPEDLPFDLLTLRHVQYVDTEPGREKLRKDLTGLVGAVLELIRST